MGEAPLNNDYRVAVVLYPRHRQGHRRGFNQGGKKRAEWPGRIPAPPIKKGALHDAVLLSKRPEKSRNGDRLQI